jgi:hypothetical protein
VFSQFCLPEEFWSLEAWNAPDGLPQS